MTKLMMTNLSIKSSLFKCNNFGKSDCDTKTVILPYLNGKLAHDIVI